jgi:hypothetical protein
VTWFPAFLLDGVVFFLVKYAGRLLCFFGVGFNNTMV